MTLLAQVRGHLGEHEEALCCWGQGSLEAFERLWVPAISGSSCR